MLIVGLTGGIATGKSSVSRSLHERHRLKIIDADLIARQVVEPGMSAYKKIVEYFQPKVENLLLEDGQLNRTELGKYVFRNKSELNILNSFTHPAVRYEIFRQLLVAYLNFRQMVILDVPLLFESGLDNFCDTVVTVVCTPELQIERLLKRNPELTIGEAQNRIDSQMSNHLRVKQADLVIDNSGTFETLERQIDGTVELLTPDNNFTFWIEMIPPIGLIGIIARVLLRRVHQFVQSKSEVETIKEE